ncbi:MAG TPA: ABC-2 family transporter protein [Candidatus Limnocylindrales bacterium]
MTSPSLRPIRRGIYLYFRLLGQQMKSILAYEADFVVLIFAAVLTQMAGFIFIWTIFQRIPDINGWTFWQVVTMYALVYITEGVASLFFEGTWWLGYLVWSGDFDKILVKPVSPIIQVITTKVGFNGVGNLVTGFTLMGIAVANVPVHWTPGRALMVAILVVSAATIRVAVNLATASTGFFFRNPWSMVPMFVHQLAELAKYPITIYSAAIQALVVVAVPFAFISFFPTAYIFEVDAFSPAGLLTPLVALYCVVLAVWLFRRGLGRYESSGH